MTQHPVPRHIQKKEKPYYENYIFGLILAGQMQSSQVRDRFFLTGKP